MMGPGFGDAIARDMAIALIGIVLVAALVGGGLTYAAIWIYERIDIEFSWAKKPSTPPRRPAK
jgi:hypothetical protein